MVGPRPIVKPRIDSAPAEKPLHRDSLLDAHRPPRQLRAGGFDRPAKLGDAAVGAGAGTWDTAQPNCASERQQRNRKGCQRQRNRRLPQQALAVRIESPVAGQEVRWCRHCA